MYDGRNYEDFEKHPYKEIKMQEIAPSIAIDEKKSLILQKRKRKPKQKKGENHESIFNHLFGEFARDGVVFHLHVKQD